MRIIKQFYRSITLTAILYAAFAISSLAQDNNNIVSPDPNPPVILSTSPSGGESAVALNSAIKITFSSEMDESSLNRASLQLHSSSSDSMYKDARFELGNEIKERSERNEANHQATVVGGTVTYSNKTAVFTPDNELEEGTTYTFTVSTEVMSADNVALEEEHNWTFTTTKSSDTSENYTEYDRSDMENKTERTVTDMSDNRNYQAQMSSNNMMNNQRSLIELGSASDFVILTKMTVNHNTESTINGKVGEGSSSDENSDRKSADMKGEKETEKDHTATWDKTSKIKADRDDTSSTNVEMALEDMMAAFDEALMQKSDSSTNEKNESFSQTTFEAGVHEWSDSLNIESNVTLAGSANDVWIFKTSDNLIVSKDTKFTLTNGAQASNIYWIVEGNVTIKENAHFEGIILSKDEISLKQGATLNGRLYSQSEISLDGNTITQPKKMIPPTSSKDK